LVYFEGHITCVWTKNQQSYSIPIAIVLLENYPHSAPEISVLTTAGIPVSFTVLDNIWSTLYEVTDILDVAIARKHPAVDERGAVRLPYLDTWSHSYNLSYLSKILQQCNVFTSSLQ
jgi:ubiquitin-protein ligase